MNSLLVAGRQRSYIIAALIMVSSSEASFGHDYPLHVLICSNAFQTSAALNLFITNNSVPALLSANPPSCPGTRSARDWLQQGSVFEDEETYFGIAEQRCLDHFYT